MICPPTIIDTLARSLPKQVRPEVANDGDYPVAFLTGDSWAPFLVTALSTAEHSVELLAYIVSTRWPKLATDSNNVWLSLLAASTRGVQCRAVVAGHKLTSATANYNTHAARRLREAGWSIRRTRPARLLHAKFLCIDNSLCIIGSHNIAHAASITNTDVSVALSGPQSVAICRRMFSRLFSSANSDPITP